MVRSTRPTSTGPMRFSTGRASNVIVDATPFILDGERVNSRLWALIKRSSERGAELHTTHPVLAQVWRNPGRQANLARALQNFEIHALDEATAVGRKLADSDTSDVVDAHLAVVAQQLSLIHI